MNKKPLVCFAVPQEHKYFRAPGGVLTLVTGMGAIPAREALSKALESEKPACIVAAGFAGALNPGLNIGQVILDDRDGVSEEICPGFASMPDIVCGRVFSASRVLVDPRQKRRLQEETGADAVDLESQAIRVVAEQNGIPMLALRVISDAASFTLPLDFNRCLTPKGTMHLGYLLGYLIRHPSTLPALMRFHKQVRLAALQLGKALDSMMMRSSF